MTNPTTQKRYRFSAVALASGASPKAIRNWIDKGDVMLDDADTEREGTRWRRFSAWDALRIAIARRLIEFSAPVSIAWGIAGDAMPKVLQTYKNTPPQALVAYMTHRALIAWQDASGWRHDVIRDEPPDDTPDAFLWLDLRRIAADVIAKLEAAEDD